MRLSTLILTTLLSTSLASPTDRTKPATVVVRHESHHHPLTSLASRAVSLFRRDSTETGQSEQDVKSGLITSLLPYIITGKSGLLGDVIDGLIALLEKLGLKKRGTPCRFFYCPLNTLSQSC